MAKTRNHVRFNLETVIKVIAVVMFCGTALSLAAHYGEIHTDLVNRIETMEGNSITVQSNRERLDRIEGKLDTLISFLITNNKASETK